MGSFLTKLAWIGFSCLSIEFEATITREVQIGFLVSSPNPDSKFKHKNSLPGRSATSRLKLRYVTFEIALTAVRENRSHGLFV